MLRELSIDHYLEEVKKLSVDDLLNRIRLELEEAKGDSLRTAFFKGEEAFYKKEYKTALKYYMQTKGIPLFQFFCYRTCAFLFYEENKQEKALDFINKALQLYSDDLPSLSLKNQLTPHHDDLPPNADTKVPEMEDYTQMLAQSEATLEIEIPILSAADHHPVERRIHAFLEKQKRRLNDYVDQFQYKHSHQDYLLHIFDGWHDESCGTFDVSSWSTSGGYFLKWQGKGIAINPGHHFLASLHKQGLHVRDIDYVIVTKSDHDAFADVKSLYHLNALVNNNQNDVHVIHYYLGLSAYQQLANYLKPKFKQERHSVHCLELFVGSSEAEMITLTDGISLHYFAGSSQQLETCGFRLDLTGPGHLSSDHSHPIKLGYLSDTAWTPIFSEHLAGCDLLILGVNTTNSEDLNRLRYNEDCLGYYGCLSLIEEIAPRLTLCCEYSGTEGDIRLEIVKKMRTDVQNNGRSMPILPGDNGLEIDLTTLQIRNDVAQTSVDPSQIHVMRTTNNFGSLHFVPRQTIL
jgi:hypothetical protein